MQKEATCILWMKAQRQDAEPKELSHGVIRLAPHSPSTLTRKFNIIDVLVSNRSM